MIPSIEVAKNFAGYLDSTVGYLSCEFDQADLFKDTAILQRLSDLDKMEAKDKSYILQKLDGFIKSLKLKNIAAI